MPVQRGAGVNLSVDITMTAGGFACVQGDTVAGQALYTVPVHSATVNEVLAGADPTNPRVDSVILEALDNVHDASGSNLARTRVLTGTPNAAATLDNRLGASTVPANALLLADVLVGNGVTSVDNTKIRDRRKWCRGAFTRLRGSASGTNYTRALSTLAEIDSTNLKGRVECSGVPIRFLLTGLWSVASGIATMEVFEDGVAIPALQMQNNGTVTVPMTLSAPYVPAAGSHVYSLAYRAGTGTVTVINQADVAQSSRPVFTITEEIRQNVGNNSVTSG